VENGCLICLGKRLQVGSVDIHYVLFEHSLFALKSITEI
jgi:hypothetical protein